MGRRNSPGQQKRHAGHEFRKNNKRKGKAKARRPPPGEQIQPVNRVPTLERELQIKASLKKVKAQERHRTNDDPRDNNCDSERSAVHSKDIRAKPKCEKTKRTKKMEKLKLEHAIKCLQSMRREITLSQQSFHPPPPSLRTSDIVIDSQASSFASFNSSTHEPFVR